MKSTTADSSADRAGETVPHKGGFPYNTIAIYPNFADVGDALWALKNAGFTDDQISVLGREQEHWQEKLGQEWETLKTAKGAAAGAAMGAIPGLVLVSGMALTGGIGLLVMGPMIAGLSALGLGAVVGSVMGAGAASGNLDITETRPGTEEDVANAIRAGHWVIVVHCHTQAEAVRAHAVLPDRSPKKSIAREDAAATPPLSERDAERVDMRKLHEVVEEAMGEVANVSSIPAQEVMCHMDEIDALEPKQAARAAIKKIALATDLYTAQIIDIFRANQVASLDDIVNRLHEQSKVKRATF